MINQLLQKLYYIIFIRNKYYRMMLMPQLLSTKFVANLGKERNEANIYRNEE